LCGVIQVLSIISAIIAALTLVAGIASLSSQFKEPHLIGVGGGIFVLSIIHYAAAEFGLAFLDGIAHLANLDRRSREIRDALDKIPKQAPTPPKPRQFLNPAVLEGSLRHIWSHRADPDECRKEWDRLQAAIASDGGGDDSAPYQEVIDRLAREGILSDRHAKALANLLGLRA
jgi:hypothetical protein